MKRTTFLLACFLLCCTAKSQLPVKEHGMYEDFPYSHILKVNLLSPIAGTLNIHYEQKHDENSSSQIELFYFTGQYFGQQIGAKGLGLTYNYRFYLTEHFPYGWYLQPFFRYQQYWTEQSSTVGFGSITIPDNHMYTLGLGMVFGYQYVFKKRIALDLYGGPVYNKSYINGQQTSAFDTGPLFNGGFMRMGTTIGFIF